MTGSPFLDALGADGPAADRAGKMDLYGRFLAFPRASERSARSAAHGESNHDRS